MTVITQQEPQSLRSLLKGNVLILTISRVLWSASDAIVLPYLSLYILGLGGDKPTIGLVYAMGSLAACLLYPVGGYIADKAGRAKFVGVSTFLYVSSFVIFAFAPSWEWIAVAVIYQNIVMFYMPALNAIMADSIPPGARGRLYSLTVAIPNAVRIFTPYIGGLLIARLTLKPAMRVGYLFSLGIGLIVAYMRLNYLKETITTQEKISKNPLTVLVEGYKNVIGSVKWTLTNLRAFSITSMIMAFSGSIIMPFWIVYAQEMMGLTEYQWGTVMLVGGVAKTIMSFFVGNIVDKIGSRKCFMISFSVAIPGMYLFTVIPNYISLILLYVGLVLSAAFMWIASSVYLADSIPREMRGRVMAGLGSGMTIGVTGGGYASGFLIFLPMTVGSMIGGYIYNINPSLPWYLHTGFLLIGLLLTVFVLKDPQKAQE